MSFTFTCWGHEHITAQHKNTLEFTKDDFVTRTGDCIVGCKADFNYRELKDFIEEKIRQYQNNKKNSIDKNIKNKSSGIEIKIIIEVDGIKEKITGFLNPDFDDDREIVVRKSDFLSKRTLVYGSDKGAGDLDYGLKSDCSFLSTKIDITFK